MKYYLIFLLLIITGSFSDFEDEELFDKDAGYIPSFAEKALISTSSNNKDAHQISDYNFNSFWQSEAPLPEAFLKRNDQNILKGLPVLGQAADGNLTTFSETSTLKIPFKKLQYLHSLSIKLETVDKTRIYSIGKNGSKNIVAEISKDQNYQLLRKSINQTSRELIIASDSPFKLFEIGALERLPREYAIIKFKKQKPIGQIRLRHWAGEDVAKSSRLYYSKDGKEWQYLKELSLDEKGIETIYLNQPVLAQFLKIEHELFDRDWNKCFLWEVKVYDQNGPYGPMPIAMPSPVSIGEMLGVNGYWGWGHKQYSNTLKKGEGPFKYAPLVSHARNYHDMSWDLNDPDQNIDFKAMSNGEGTLVNDWLNWDLEYQTWIDAGLNIQASLQFYRFKDREWDNPFQSAYNYANGFVSHYGPSKGNGMVCSIEAGNEPWEYEADIYRKILLGMSKGAKEADAKVEVFPCALQAVDPHAEVHGPYKNYIGARVPKESLKYLDGINVHAYSYRKNILGRRIGTYPENKNSTFWEVLNAIRWRDQNMAGKKIYLSEWGWDGEGGGEKCTHSECLSENEVAVYALRNILIASRLGIDRATWFFYANDEVPSSLYMRSGLTGSKQTNFEPKKVFHAFKAIQEKIGDLYFVDLIKEDDEAWIYKFGDVHGKISHVIGWVPASLNAYSRKKNIKFAISNKVKNAEYLYQIHDSDSINFSQEAGVIEIELGPNPILLELF